MSGGAGADPGAPAGLRGQSFVRSRRKHLQRVRWDHSQGELGGSMRQGRRDRRDGGSVPREAPGPRPRIADASASDTGRATSGAHVSWCDSLMCDARDDVDGRKSPAKDSAPFLSESIRTTAVVGGLRRDQTGRLQPFDRTVQGSGTQAASGEPLDVEQDRVPMLVSRRKADEYQEL